MTILAEANGLTIPYFVLTNEPVGGGQSLPVHIYADPGTTVTVEVGTSTGGVNGFIAISGHYINVP